MIGATDIMRLAGACEKALQQRRPVDAVEATAGGSLHRRSPTLRDEAAPYLKRQQSRHG